MERTRSPRPTSPSLDPCCPRYVSDGDIRITSAGQAQAVIGRYMRFGTVLEESVGPLPTALQEYTFPEFVLNNPQPAVVLLHNRTVLLAHVTSIDPGVSIEPGRFWLYETTNPVTELQEHRVRVGLQVDPQDCIIAQIYIRDYERDFVDRLT